MPYSIDSSSDHCYPGTSCLINKFFSRPTVAAHYKRSEPVIPAGIPPQFRFQSTRPLRGRTQMGRHPNRHHPISIHAPRGGATTAGGYLRPSTANFNPPAPCGAGLKAGTADNPIV